MTTLANTQCENSASTPPLVLSPAAPKALQLWSIKPAPASFSFSARPEQVSILGIFSKHVHLELQRM